MPVKVLISDAEAFPEGSGPEARGYELRKVSGVPELVSRLTKERPDAVVLDYATASAPSISKAKSLLEWMQGHYAAKFVVTADPERRAEAAVFCARTRVALQVKPVGAAALLAAVEGALKGRAQAPAPMPAARPAAAAAPAGADAREAEVLRKVEDFIYNLTGIRVPKTHNLAATVRKRMETLRFDDAAHYFGRLTTSREEAQTLIEEVTINETYFFRNTAHFDCLRDHVFPEIIRRGQAAGRKEVAMWSAACSTGEEPYSLAMLAREVFPRDWAIRIHASDIDSKVVRFAEAGVYPRMRVARTPPAYMDLVARHLRGSEDACAFDADIKRLVTFKRESIFESGLRGLDLIFCRNVMIYFDQAGVARMADVFNASLRDEGVVIIGHSELLRAKPDTLHYCRVGGASLYRKRQAARKAA